MKVHGVPLTNTGTRQRPRIALPYEKWSEIFLLIFFGPGPIRSEVYVVPEFVIVSLALDQSVSVRESLG